MASSPSNSSYSLDVSNTTSPTQFLLHPQAGAPSIPGQPDDTPVSLRVSINNTKTGSAEDYCAEFESRTNTQSPIVVNPCSPDWDITSSSSQLFVYNTVTSGISPFWPSLFQNLTSSNDTTTTTDFTVTAPPGSSAEGGGQGAYMGSKRMENDSDGSNNTETTSATTPAFLVFSPAPESMSTFNALFGNDDGDDPAPDDGDSTPDPDATPPADAPPPASPDDTPPGEYTFAVLC